MKDGRTFQYATSGDHNGKIATNHPVWDDSVIIIGRNKYRVQGDPTPIFESKADKVHLKLIEIHAVEIG
jgi:hypothetical protein